MNWASARSSAGCRKAGCTNVAFPVPGGPPVTMGNFESLPPPYNYVAMMPQWDFLNFLADAAAAEPSFTLRMSSTATALVRNGGRVTGVRYRAADGTEGELRADLVVATDGRHSTLRRAAGLAPKEYRVPFDTWWFRLPRHASEQGAVAGIVPAFGRGEALLALNRTDYYQMGYLAPKGTDARIRAEGIERFRQRIAALRPDLADRVDAIASLADLHWLDVRLDRLRDWHINGLLCIGDAAHAMSPGRRRRDQPGHPGRRGRRGLPGPGAAPRPGLPRGPREGRTTAADAHRRRADRPAGHAPRCCSSRS